MRKVTMFNLVTLDGYFAGPGGDISWFAVDEEFQPIAETNSTKGNTLLFGRVTYEHMAAFWPTDEALRTQPVVARGMNESPKIVFSRTLAKADWANTRLVKDDLVGEVRRLKQGSGKDLTIIGSGSLVPPLAAAGLIDEYQFMLNPVAIGQGRSLFEGLQGPLRLKLIGSRSFRNGNLLLTYAPAG